MMATSSCSKGGFHHTRKDNIASTTLLPNPNITHNERAGQIFKLCHSNVEVKNNAKTIQLWLTPDKDNEGIFLLDTTQYRRGNYTQTLMLSDNVKLKNVIPAESLFTSDSNKECVRLTGRYALDTKKLPGNGQLYLYVLVIHPTKTSKSHLNFGTPKTIAAPPQIIRVNISDVCEDFSAPQISQSQSPEAAAQQHQSSNALKQRRGTVRFNEDKYSDDEGEAGDGTTTGTVISFVSRLKKKSIEWCCRLLLWYVLCMVFFALGNSAVWYVFSETQTEDTEHVDTE
jgi:hypothetical protein